jgi:hypothetical protein
MQYLLKNEPFRRGKMDGHALKQQLKIAKLIERGKTPQYK